VNDRKFKMGLIGGGGKGFIGRVHVTAATLDREAELVAGAFSSDPSKALSYAADFGVQSERAYATYEKLLQQEQLLSNSEKVDFVSIATPNHTHAKIAVAALRSGFHVICDKPMTTNLEDAKSLVEVVAETNKVFALTHNYFGYPMVCQAREMIQNGDLGGFIAFVVY